MNEQLVLSGSFLRYLEGSRTRIAKLLRKYHEQERDGYIQTVNRYYFRWVRQRSASTGEIERVYRMQPATTYKEVVIRPLQKLFTTAEINYLSFRNDGTISYLPAGKTHGIGPDGRWKREGRQNGKPAKVIRKLLSEAGQRIFRDKQLEEFANCYKASSTCGDYIFELRPSSDIGMVYDEFVDAGSLGQSCMRGKGNRMGIYENCERLQILILKYKNESLVGRALVWTINDGGKDIVLMDRVYYTQDSILQMFVDYASDKGWWYKSSQGSGVYSTFINSTGDRVEDKYFRIDTKTCGFESYPYLDTFVWGESGCLTNQETNENGTYYYQSTNGHRFVYSDIGRRGWMNECNAVTITHGPSAGKIANENDVIEWEDMIWNRNEACMVTYPAQMIAARDEVIVARTRRDGRGWVEEVILKSEAVEFRGEWYHLDAREKKAA